MLLSLETLPGKEVLSDTLVSSSIWKILCIVLLLANLKNLPLVWHVSTCCLVLFAAGLPNASTLGSITQCFPLRT